MKNVPLALNSRTRGFLFLDRITSAEMELSTCLKSTCVAEPNLIPALLVSLAVLWYTAGGERCNYAFAKQVRRVC